MPGAFRVIVGVPTHGMRVSQPPKEFRQLLVRLWSNHKVPVIGNQTIRKNRQRNSSDGFGKHSIECFVVRRLFKQCQSRHSSVEHMEAHSSRAFPTTSWHCPSVTKQNHRVKQNNELRPLFPSLFPSSPSSATYIDGLEVRRTPNKTGTATLACQFLQRLPDSCGSQSRIETELDSRTLSHGRPVARISGFHAVGVMPAWNNWHLCSAF